MDRDYDISTLPEIAVSRLLPYRTNQACPKCGNRERRGWFWALINRMNLLHRGYCMGDKPPTLPVPTPDGKMVDAPTVCASVRREHVHLHCPSCGYNFMCEVKEHA